MAQSRLDHVADYQVHFPDCHGAADRKKTKAVFITRHGVQRFGSSGNLRSDAVVGSKIRYQLSDRGSLAIDPFVQGSIENRYNVARVGKNGIGKIAVFDLSGWRHTERVDINAPRGFRINRLGVSFRECADDDDVLASDFAPSILGWGQVP